MPGVSFESDAYDKFHSINLEKTPVKVTGVSIKRPAPQSSPAQREIIFSKCSKLMNYCATDDVVIEDKIPEHMDYWCGKNQGFGSGCDYKYLGQSY